MKRARIIVSAVLLIVGACLSIKVVGQKSIEDLSAEEIVDEVFTIVSGQPDKERNWERFKLLFKPTAQFMVAPKDIEKGGNRFVVRTVDEIIDGQSGWLKENPLFEYCIFKQTEKFRHLAHILCTYESKKNETELYGRGISSFQLMHDGTRWWIVNWFWLGESENETVPTKYLPPKK